MSGKGEHTDPWQFLSGTPIQVQETIRFPVKPDGVELDFSWAAFSILVVTTRFVNLFERLGIKDVQFIPALVDGHTGPFFILNTLRTIRCIDDARCERAIHWQPEDGQPDKVGQYRTVMGMRIDPEKASGAHIFRTWGFYLGLIVSEELKLALEHERITGTRFVAV